MTDVKIIQNNDKIEAHTPYHPSFPDAAKKLGGKWNREAWVFDARDETKVRELCQKIYGTDGVTGMEDLVTLKVELLEDISAHTSAIFIAGRMIARARGRDSGAQLGDGIVVLGGRGFISGGSMKNWRTIGVKGTVFEIRDIPRKAINLVINDEEDVSDYMKIEIVDETINREALMAEREKLTTRITEIDKLLKGE